MKAHDVAEKLRTSKPLQRNPRIQLRQRDRRSSGCTVQADPYETNWQRRLWFGSRQLTSTAGADFTTAVDDLSRPTRHTVRSSDEASDLAEKRRLVQPRRDALNTSTRGHRRRFYAGLYRRRNVGACCARTAHVLRTPLRWLRRVASSICLPSCRAGHSGPGIPRQTAPNPARGPG